MRRAQCAVLLLLLAVISTTNALSPLDLGAGAGFIILAGAGITNTGPTTLTGDVGSYPTNVMSGFGTVTLNGVNQGGGLLTQAAKGDILTAYNTAVGLGPAAALSVDIGGQVLPAGIYHGGSIGITGAVTLDGGGDFNAVFIFQADTTVITASASQVILINGTQSRNVFWAVGSSATLGAFSVFEGTILATTSITINAKVVLNGRALAGSASVTLDTVTINRPNINSETRSTSGTKSSSLTKTKSPSKTKSHSVSNSKSKSGSVSGSKSSSPTPTLSTGASPSSTRGGTRSQSITKSRSISNSITPSSTQTVSNTNTNTNSASFSNNPSSSLTWSGSSSISKAVSNSQSRSETNSQSRSGLATELATGSGTQAAIISSNSISAQASGAKTQPAASSSVTKTFVASGTSFCGNGVVEGCEQCDDGGQFLCCTPSCHFAQVSIRCGSRRSCLSKSRCSAHGECKNRLVKRDGTHCLTTTEPGLKGLKGRCKNGICLV